MTTNDWINIAVAVGTILLAAFAFWQIVAASRSQPDLDLRVDEEGIESRLEGNKPWIRLLVANRRGRRIARHTRVIVQSVRKTDYADSPVSLAGPELGWPSTAVPEGGGAVIFGGTTKPVDFGTLGIGPTDVDLNGPSPPVTALMQDNVNLISEGTHQWWFRFTLAMNGQGVVIARQFLPPLSGGYTARLVVGADEGRAHTFDVRFTWVGNASSAEQALGSLLITVIRIGKPHRMRWPRRRNP